MKVGPQRLKMNIIKTRLWSRPDVIFRIINPSSALDPIVLLSNSELFLLYDANELCSFAVVKSYTPSVRELKSVYTYPKHRKQGYASQLIRHIRKRHKHLNLVCRLPLFRYYKRIGFVIDENPPSEIAWKVSIWNFFFGQWEIMRALTLKSKR